MALGHCLEARLAVASRPVRQIRVILAQFILRHDREQLGAQLSVVDVYSGKKTRTTTPPITSPSLKSRRGDSGWLLWHVTHASTTATSA